MLGVRGSRSEFSSYSAKSFSGDNAVGQRGGLMTDGELEALLNDLESDRIERKSSISDADKISQAICAFANDLPNHQMPGVLFVGVQDDGQCANLRITDELLITL